MVISIFLLIISISLISLTMKGKVNYGGRCTTKIDENIILNHNYKDIILTSNYLGCNTYYLEYNSDLEEKENIIFLASLSKLLSDNNININMHVIIKNQNYQLIATIVDYNISYVKTLI